jgi:CDP-glucose 4,6-dehydratase
MNDNFWVNKKVFITGVNGFVGGNLAEHLVKKGANVYGLIRNINPNTYLFFMKLNNKVEIINGSITDKELLKGFFTENEIDVCFHLAAQVEVGVAAKYPYLTWETNVRGTYCLLEAIKDSCPNISAIIIASSDKAYGEYPIEELPYKEDYPLKPSYPYDTSKACADLIAQSYSSDLYNMPIIITRFANIYGPGQLNFSALIPDAIKSALEGNQFLPRSNGKSKRDFLFVNDVADLYCIIGENLSKEPNLRGEIFNAGTNQEKSVREVIEDIYGILNKDAELKVINKYFELNPSTAQGEINFQSMDYSKVEKYFNWQPKTSFLDGLNRSIEWYKHYLANENSI